MEPPTAILDNKAPSPCQCQKQLFLVTQVQGERGARGFVWIGFPVAGTDGQRPTGNNPAFPASRSHSSIPPLKRRAARGTPPELTMLQQLHLHGAVHPWRLQDSFLELGKKCVHRHVHRSALSLPTLPTSDADRLTTSVPSRHLPGTLFRSGPAPKLSPRSVASCLQPSPTAIIRSCRPSGLDATYCPAREVVLNHQRPGSRWLPNAPPCAFLPTANPRGVDSRAAGYPLRHQRAIAPFPARPPTQPRAPHPLRDT